MCSIPIRFSFRVPERETLACLLEGDSERQAAARLGVSSLTAHQYVKSLYRRFKVRSRAELLAYFLRRQRGMLRFQWQKELGGRLSKER